VEQLVKFSFGAAESIAFELLIAVSVLMTHYLLGFYQDKQRGFARLGRKQISL
jgi:hypothetical protein